MLTRGKIFAAAFSVAVIGWSSSSANAGDIFGLFSHGHGYVSSGCSTCGHAPLPSHPQMVPVSMQPVPMQYSYGRPMMVVRQMPGEPPEPAPKWARPPGTVPVIALREPPPRWVHPAALAVNSTPGFPPAGATPLAVTTVPTYSTQLPAGVRFQQGPQVQMLRVNNGLLLAQNGQPAAAGVGAGVPVNPRNGAAAAAAAANAAAAVNSAQKNATNGAAVNGAPSNAGTIRGNVIVPINPNTVMQPSLAPRSVAPFQSGQIMQGNPVLGSVPVYPVAPQRVQLPPPAPVRTAPGVARYQAFSDKPGPPPGTLGKTYQRPTRMIAWDKHPRIGMVDIEVLDSMRVGLAHDVKIKVITQDIYNNNKPLEGFFGEDNVWHFESDPLLPLVPHIYDVRFELIRERRVQEMRYGRMFERIKEDKLGTIGIRRIRLIPGRIVDLVLY
jgi:hypothetical protein